MKMTVKNLAFNLAPIKCIASESDAKMPEDVNVDIDSEGASFGIDEITMEVSIAELCELTGHKATTAPTQTEAEKAKVEEARAKATETLDRANELTDICRGILRKVNELKEASKAPKKSAPKVAEVTTNDDDEFI